MGEAEGTFRGNPTTLTCGACHGTFVLHDGEMLYSDTLGTRCNHRVMSTETTKLRERIEAIAALCRQFSPSIIPELREHAKKEREALRVRYPTTKPQPIYPYDYACDFIEAVMTIALEGSENLGHALAARFPQGFAVYDELRNYGRGDGDSVCSDHLATERCGKCWP